jgi:hypothetical protein
LQSVCSAQSLSSEIASLLGAERVGSQHRRDARLATSERQSSYGGFRVLIRRVREDLNVASSCSGWPSRWSSFAEAAATGTIL